ncbi:MAG: M42 family metallopeptidase, partial [Clostridia bacterium]|nr:M42 family metallopeptidase [Clostridia bacterium]
MPTMLETLKTLCELDGVSGSEHAVRQFILSRIEGFCEDITVDPLGNIIALKKGENRPQKRVMLDAHMDEVGLIVTAVTEEGFLKFTTVGGINPEILLFRRVRFGNVPGAISGKPIHLLNEDERKKLPPSESLYIDIGASSREEALKLVRPGDTGVLIGDFVRMGDALRAKALDDRVGCAILISLLQSDVPYDFYAVFSVQEEIGLRGAKAATFTVDPDAAIVLEATTAADLAGTEPERRVCTLGKGPAVSFMDRSTVYDRVFYKAALSSGIPCQPKAAVAGGNNAGAVHLSRGGVRTLAISVPCRYIHSPSCVCREEDIGNAER